jgi:hypothetical protein
MWPATLEFDTDGTPHRRRRDIELFDRQARGGERVRVWWGARGHERGSKQYRDGELCTDAADPMSQVRHAREANIAVRADPSGAAAVIGLLSQ